MSRRVTRRPPGDDPTPQHTTRRRKQPGHPPVVGDENRVRRMLQALEVGIPVTAACEHAGISPTSHHRAMEAGAEADTHANDHGEHTLTDRQRLYREYRDGVLRARAKATVVGVTLISNVAHGGQLKKEVVRRFRNEDGEMVTETEREYTTPDWRAAKFLVQTGSHGDALTERTRSSVEVTGAGGGPVELAPAEEILTGLAQRLQVVAERQAQQLEGGWDPPAEIEDGSVTDAELVDEGDR